MFKNGRAYPWLAGVTEFKRSGRSEDLPRTYWYVKAATTSRQEGVPDAAINMVETPASAGVTVTS